VFEDAHTTSEVRATRRRSRRAITLFGRCLPPCGAYARLVDEVERLLRRLALNDEESVGQVLLGVGEHASPTALDRKVDLLVQLGALLALGGSTSSLRPTVERAIEAGANESEIVEVLLAVGPAVGLARVVAAAPRLATALGYEIDADE
jgi:4-carboxymuconolactone decarboxylase